MNIEIKHRYTGAVLWSGEAESLAAAVVAATKDGSKILRGADLGGADLGGADLGGARMPDSFDRSKHKDPETPFVRRTPTGDMPRLSREERQQRRQARLAERKAAYRAAHPDVPVVEHLDAVILRSIETQLLVLDMGNWHGPSGATGSMVSPEACGTTHCRAGSAIHLAGRAGYELEKRLGSAEEAGRAIYIASTGRAPHFYGSNERALADIRRCAEEDPLPAETP